MDATGRSMEGGGGGGKDATGRKIDIGGGEVWMQSKKRRGEG